MRTYGITAILAVTMALASLTGSAGAEDTYWQHDPATPGDWFDPANWTAGVPAVGDAAYIDNGGAVRIDGGTTERPERIWIGYADQGSLELTDGTVSASSIVLGRLDGAVGQYVMTGGVVSAFHMGIGSYGRGVFTQTGGAVRSGMSLGIGSGDGGTGTYALAGAASLDADLLTLGGSGTGTFVQNGGSVLLRHDSWFGRGDAGSGSYTLNDGEFTANEFLYLSQTAQFVQEGGTASIYGLYFRPESDDRHGTYTLNDGELTSRYIHVGLGGGGSFTQTGGTCTPEELVVPSGSSYSLSGGTLSITSGADIQGTFAFGNGTPTLGVEGIGSFTKAAMSNTGAPALTVGANGLACFPSNFDPYVEFASVTNNGIIHQGESPVTVGASATVVGQGGIDIHVNLQGQMDTPGPYVGITIREGIFVSGDGEANLRQGDVIIQNNISGMSGGLLKTNHTYIGKERPGRFVQTGGLHDCYRSGSYGDLRIGYDEGAVGQYELGGDGELHARDVFVGWLGTGRFIQDGGKVSLWSSSRVQVGSHLGGTGYYELNDGELHAHSVYVNRGTFRQTGGLCSASSSSAAIGIAASDDADPVYEMLGGTIEVPNFRIGRSGTGRFVQSGGQVNITGDATEIGTHNHGNGTYELSGTGVLNTDRLYMGYFGSSVFLQSGGTVDGILQLDMATRDDSRGNALYRISGGSLNVRQLTLGANSLSTAMLDIADAAAEITILSKLTVKPTGVIRAVPGAKIDMRGFGFENQSTDPEALEGLSNLTFVYGTGYFNWLEVAGKDLGPAPRNLEGNFALGTLTLGRNGGCGRVTLVDAFDNQPAWEGSEALYVRTLIAVPGSSIDLNGLKLYYVNGTIDPSVQFIGGTPVQIPEPATLSLLTLGALAMLRRWRRR